MTLDLGVYRHRTYFAQVGPQHVKRAAPNQFTVDLGNPELLDGLVERHQILLEKDLAGVDIDQSLHRGHIRGSGTPDGDLAGICAHTWRVSVRATDILL